MRPLKLTIEGLRSFRAPVEIDFNGRHHLAVIGDTGAGKTSIIEAITYALFGRMTFTGHANQVVMNDTSTQLRVVLRFAIGSDTFEVTRTLRRARDGSVGSPRASLTRFVNDEAVSKVEQARLVTSEVERILGLDAEGFLRTVVLPQGRFAQLLVGDDPTHRATILAQVWRTDELVRAGHLADEALGDIGPMLGRAQGTLQGTPDDPEAHLAQLRRTAAKLVTAAKKARLEDRKVRDAREALGRAAADAATAADVISRLAAFDGSEASEAAEPLADVARSVEGERRTLAAQEQELRSQLAAVPDDDDGLDAAQVATARVTLDRLPGLATSAERVAKKARTAVKEHAALLKDLDKLAQEEADLAADIEARQSGRKERESRLAETETALDKARELLRTAAQSAAETERLKEEADQQQEEAVRLLGLAIDLEQEELAKAEQAAERIRKVYEDAQRQDAAATAAHDLHSGDDCPVCSRELPPAWASPKARNLKAASKADKAAQEEVTRIRGVKTKFEADAAAAESQAKRLRDLAAKRLSNAREAADRLAALIGRDEVDVRELPAPDALQTGVDDPPLLESLALTANSAHTDLRTYDDQTGSLREQHATLTEKVNAAKPKAEELEAEVDQRCQESREAVDLLLAALEVLPDTVRPDVELPEDLIVLEVVQLKGVDAAQATIKVRKVELGRRASRRAEIGKALEGLHDQSEMLNERWAKEVEGPATKLVGELNGHRDVLARMVERLGLEDVALSAPSTVSGVADLPAAVATLAAATSTITAQAKHLSGEAQRAADDARTLLVEVAMRLHVLSVDDELDPDQVVGATEEAASEATYKARSASEEAELFAAQVDPLLALRKAANELAAAHRVLTDLSSGLKPGAFPKWLTLRRSQALLVHASRLLLQMSGGRYAFAEVSDEAEEWRVIDNDSGVARSPASLSGGEQFVASLALALGMVEMMARSGGRLESLWLDEGFGSLDRSNLDAAIEALSQVAASGRMVAVVSHVRAVAEEVEHVLAVTRTAVGSRARWLEPAERTDLAISDLDPQSAGVLSGLIG